MQEIEKWSRLMVVLEEQEEPMTISEIRKKAGMHFNTVEKMLEFLQASQGLPFLVKITKRKHSSLVFKTPNNDGNILLNSKIDRIEKSIEKILKKWKL